MQGETRRQGFGRRGPYRIDEFQVRRLFECVIPSGVVLLDSPLFDINFVVAPASVRVTTT
jgi:hypothetical protein